MKYRIEETFDSVYGEQFYPQYQVKFLFWTYWKYFERVGGRECFSSLSRAREFIKRTEKSGHVGFHEVK